MAARVAGSGGGMRGWAGGLSSSGGGQLSVMGSSRGDRSDCAHRITQRSTMYTLVLGGPVARLAAVRAFLGMNTRALGDTPNELIPSRAGVGAPGSVVVTESNALRHSGVWAAQRLRANLISSLPVHAQKRSYTTGVMQKMPLPPFFVMPSRGIDDKMSFQDWRWAPHYTLARCGTPRGTIRARNGFGLPAVIELCSNSGLMVHCTGPVINFYRYNGVRYEPEDI